MGFDQAIAENTAGRRSSLIPLKLGIALAICLAGAELPNLAAAAPLSGKADIIDADTIKVGGIPVRLHGIDAPEGRQKCELNENPMHAANKQPRRSPISS